MYGRSDFDFLERVFQKLLMNFTWWVNRKDADGKGVFEGGFLGLDNIGLFNRSEPLPTGVSIFSIHYHIPLLPFSEPPDAISELGASTLDDFASLTCHTASNCHKKV